LDNKPFLDSYFKMDSVATTKHPTETSFTPWLSSRLARIRQYIDHNQSREELYTELVQLLQIAIPALLVEVSFTVPGFLVTSYVGRRFGHEYLSSVTLALLTANLSTWAFINGILNASDTLSPQAYAAGNYRQVGILAIRGFLISLIVFILPINTFFVYHLDTLFEGALGQDKVVAEHAASWYRVFVLSLPMGALFWTAWKFLAAQAVWKPLSVVVLVCTGIIFPLTLHLLANKLGYLGTAWSMVVFQALESIALIGYLWWAQPHEEKTWPGLTWSTLREAIHWKAAREFMVRLTITQNSPSVGETLNQAHILNIRHVAIVSKSDFPFFYFDRYIVVGDRGCIKFQ